MKSIPFICVFLAALSGCAGWNQPIVKSREIKIHQVWARQTTFEHKLRARFLESMKPVIYEDLVLFGNSVDSFSAYSRRSGRTEWKKFIENGASGGAVLYKESVLFGGNDGHFYRLNVKTGERIWTYPTRAESLSAPLVDSGKVYFLSGNGTLYCLDVESGEKVWIHSRRGTSAFSVRGGAQPVIRAGKLFVGFSDGSIVAFQASDGKVLWEQKLNRNAKFRDVDATAVISGFELFVSGYDDALYNLDWSSGEVNWKYEKGGFSKVALTDQTVFYATSDGQMVALERNTGKPTWEIDVKGIATTPSFYRSYLVFGESAGNVRMVDSTTGREVAHYQPGRGVFTQPTIDEDGAVYFGSNQSHLYGAKIQIRPLIGGWPWEN